MARGGGQFANSFFLEFFRMVLFVLRAGLNYFFVYPTECASLYREETENQRSKVAGPRSHSRGRAGI